jgi:NADPH:quinone reductase-like Zn-dependent oxidoreductase
VRALTIDHGAPGHLVLAEVPEPEPALHQVLVRVAAASVNPIDHHGLPDAPPGSVPAWEPAGVVVRAAADGSGPEVGTGVTTLGPGGAWAQLRAVDTALASTVPAGVDPAAANILPIAATSALRALRALGPVLGRRVLVTGATGAVGRFAVQLAHLGGAYVIAGARSAAAADELRALGADEVLTDGPDYATDLVHGVLETVGGAHQRCFRPPAAGRDPGLVGRASGEPVTFAATDLVGDGGRHGRSLTTFFLADGTPGLGEDFTWLTERLTDGRLSAQVDVRSPWTAAAAADGPLARARGKLVLEVA